MKQSISLAVLSAGLSLLALTAAQSQTTSGSAPTVKVGSALGAMANSPSPSATAKNQSQKTSIGTGAATVKSSGPAAYWTDLVDVDDDGKLEDNQFLYDAARGVVYTYREDNYACANGTPENGSVLMGIYAKGNKAGQPAGVRMVRGCGEGRPVRYEKSRNLRLQIRRVGKSYGLRSRARER